MASMRASSPVSLGGFGASGGELSSQSPKPYMTSDKATYTTATSSTLRGCSSANLNSPSHSPSQYAVPTGRSWQSPQTVKTPDHSAVARLKHELQDERRKLQALTKSNQQSVDKMAEYKERYRGLRAAMGDKDKQLDLAKRTIERLSCQCNAMEAGVATDKAYARKLEAKLSASKSISDLHARCSQYKLKLRELAQELDEAESRTASVHEIADVRADEVGTLRQALQIKASELSKQAGADIHSRLLYAVAKSREEGLALAVQLAECKERIRQAENSADDAHDESRVLREQLDEAESQLQQMEQKLVDTAASCRGFEGNAEEIRSEVHAMQQQVRVLAGEKEDLHHQMHSEQQRSRQHLAQVATLEQQVANLERQRQQESASLRGSAEHMQREMQGHCTNLQAQLDAFQEMMERERQTASSSLARERARANAAEQAADSSSSQAEARRRQLQHDLDNAHSEVQTLNDVSQRLQSSLADTTKAHQAERLKRDNLHKQVLSLEASLSAVHNERSQSDMGLKSRMQELLSELQSTLQERGVYKAKWQQLLSQHTTEEAESESRSQLDGGVSSEEIMARLTKSPAAARFGKGPGDHHALALTQRQHPEATGTRLRSMGHKPSTKQSDAPEGVAASLTDFAARLAQHGEAFMQMFDNSEQEVSRAPKRAKLAAAAIIPTSIPSSPRYVSHSSNNSPGLLSEGVKDVLADIWSDGKQVSEKIPRDHLSPAKPTLLQASPADASTMKAEQGGSSTKPSRGDFLTMQREVQMLGAEALDRKQRKQFDAWQLQTVKAVPQKPGRVSAAIGKGIAKKQAERQQKAKEEAIASGMLTLKGSGKQKRRSDADKGLAEDGGLFKGGMLRVKGALGKDMEKKRKKGSTSHKRAFSSGKIGNLDSNSQKAWNVAKTQNKKMTGSRKKKQ
ncbi:hypothetical protein WJX79_009936 [Trebouxia sp. C0005]